MNTTTRNHYSIPLLTLFFYRSRTKYPAIHSHSHTPAVHPFFFGFRGILFTKYARDYWILPPNYRDALAMLNMYNVPLTASGAIKTEARLKTQSKVQKWTHSISNDAKCHSAILYRPVHSHSRPVSPFLTRSLARSLANSFAIHSKVVLGEQYC